MKLVKPMNGGREGAWIFMIIQLESSVICAAFQIVPERETNVLTNDANPLLCHGEDALKPLYYLIKLTAN
jgi:hypothetical protein